MASASPTPRLPKSAFANVDARVRCPTDDCWGDLVLFPVGTTDEHGMPHFQPITACPLCGQTFALDQDIGDRELFLRISWLRANPDEDGAAR